MSQHESGELRLHRVLARHLWYVGLGVLAVGLLLNGSLGRACTIGGVIITAVGAVYGWREERYLREVRRRLESQRETWKEAYGRSPGRDAESPERSEVLLGEGGHDAETFAPLAEKAEEALERLVVELQTLHPPRWEAAAHDRLIRAYDEYLAVVRSYHQSAIDADAEAVSLPSETLERAEERVEAAEDALFGTR